MKPGSELQGEPRQAESPDAKEWTLGFTPGRLALIIVLFLVGAYPEVVLGTHSFFYRDFGLFTYPTAHFARESLWRGQWPLWNPLNNSGIPFLAQWNTTVCYPLSLFYLLLPLPWSLNWFCLAHLVLAGLGMYWLALRWTGDRFAASVGGLAFALNGLSFNCLMWTSNLGALAAMPWVLLTVERGWRDGGRWLATAALVGAVQMLAGAPEIILLTWLLVGTLWLGQAWSNPGSLKSSGARLLLVFALVIGLAAVQLLPFIELLGFSDRGASEGNAAWSMPAWGWANFLVPMFRCTRLMPGTSIQVEQQWTSSYYLALGVLALALVSVWQVRSARVRWLASVAVVGVLLALGDKGVLHKILVRLLPLFGLVRYPIKFVVLTVFAVPLLAAFAMAWVNRPASTALTSARRSLVVVATVLGAILGIILACSRWLPYPGEDWLTTMGNGLIRALWLGLALAALLGLTRTREPAKQRWLGLGLLVVLGLDVLTHVPRQNPTVPNIAYASIPLELSSRPVVGQSRAMIDPRREAHLLRATAANQLEFYQMMRRSLYADCNILEAVPKVNGFYSLALRAEAAVSTLLYSPSNTPSGLMDFLGVTQISSPDAGSQWSERKTALPWVTAGQQPVFADAPAIYEGLGSPQFDPRRMVYLPAEVRPQVSATRGSAAEIVSSRFWPQRVEVEVRAPESALVVLAQAYFPAWRAFVDGKPAVLWPANLAFQAVEVPSGSHRVVLIYRDQAFYIGVALSVFSLFVCGALYFLHRLGSRD
jgi:hypothetical protein